MFVQHKLKDLVQAVTHSLLSLTVGTWKADAEQGKSDIRAAPGDLTKFAFMTIRMHTY